VCGYFENKIYPSCVIQKEKIIMHIIWLVFPFILYTGNHMTMKPGVLETQILGRLWFVGFVKVWKLKYSYLFSRKC
jgi:hypothetical protein